MLKICLFLKNKCLLFAPYDSLCFQFFELALLSSILSHSKWATSERGEWGSQVKDRTKGLPRIHDARPSWGRGGAPGNQCVDSECR